jgi:hypothetical protein
LNSVMLSRPGSSLNFSCLLVSGSSA